MPFQTTRVRQVGLVLTGGTIGAEMRPRATQDGTGIVQLNAQAGPAALGSLWGEVSDTRDLDFRIRRPVGLLSENLVPSDWLAIASACRELAEEGVDGVLILHGTDTMAYTAAALSFLLADLAIPVVLTGSNLPPNQEGSDAGKNVHDALVALRHLGSGVFVVFAGSPQADGWVHLGTRVRKVRASGHAFETVNGSAVGRVAGSRMYQLQEFPAPSPRQSCGAAAIDDRVIGLTLYPGLNLEAILRAVEASATQGIVVELYPSATGPDVQGPESLPAFIEGCQGRGAVVFTTIVAMPEHGLNLYESTIAMETVGACFLRDMLTETALAKLMWSLAHSNGDQDALKESMLTPVFADITRP